MIGQEKKKRIYEFILIKSIAVEVKFISKIIEITLSLSFRIINCIPRESVAEGFKPGETTGIFKGTQTSCVRDRVRFNRIHY